LVRRILLVSLVVLTLQCALARPSTAQNGNPCLMANAWAFGEGAWPPGWFYLGEGAGNFSYLIGAYKASCSPKSECPGGCPGSAGPSGGPSGASGGGPGGTPAGASGGGGPTPTANAPIFVTTGDTYIRKTDLSVPGLGAGLHLTRQWNSVWPANEIASSVGIFGQNWRSTYEESVFMGTDNWEKYARGDGGYWSFGVGTSGVLVVASPASASATLTRAASYYLLTLLSGEQRQFSLTTGQLIAIVDRNGNTTQLSYDSSNRLVTVTSPASQHLYFSYGAGALAYLVTSVTSDFGVTLSYSYDAEGRLVQVTKPDQTTESYTYNTQSQITAVTDNNGRVLESHTYDSSGRGLTASQANGVNAVTISYPQ
jgi:YD repeat-containing protein